MAATIKHITQLPESVKRTRDKALLLIGYFGGFRRSDWITEANIKEGPVFRPINRWGQIQSRPLSPGSINELLKEIGSACNFDFVIDLSSHSLRSGLTTSAAR